MHCVAYGVPTDAGLALRSQMLSKLVGEMLASGAPHIPQIAPGVSLAGDQQGATAFVGHNSTIYVVLTDGQMLHGDHLQNSRETPYNSTVHCFWQQQDQNPSRPSVWRPVLDSVFLALLARTPSYLSLLPLRLPG